jgi:hypothetical protein
MKLVRVGEPGRERPAVLDKEGTARDVSGIVGDFGPEFFAGGGLAALVAGQPTAPFHMNAGNTGTFAG